MDRAGRGAALEAALVRQAGRLVPGTDRPRRVRLAHFNDIIDAIAGRNQLIRISQPTSRTKIR